MLKRIWHDPVWSKVIATAILAVAGALAYHLRWISAVYTFLLTTSPVPHWVLGSVILVVLIAVGIIVGNLWSSPVPNKDPLATLVPVAPLYHPAPNMRFLKARTANVELGLNYSFFEQPRATGLMAVVACFRNEPIGGEKVLNAERVIASTVYRDSDGLEVGEGIARTVWLNEEYDTVNFNLGQSHCAILAIRHGQRLFVPYKRRQRTGYGDSLFPEEYEFHEQVSTIELRLVSRLNELLLPSIIFDFSIVEGSPQAVARSN